MIKKDLGARNGAKSERFEFCEEKIKAESADFQGTEMLLGTWMGVMSSL